MNSSTIVVAVASLASFIAFGQAAKAQIIYSPANITISGSGYITLDLNHDGKTDFTILVAEGFHFCGFPLPHPVISGAVEVMPTAGDGVVSSAGYALALGSGARIGSGQSFLESRAAIMDDYNACISPPVPSGPWDNVSNHYLGLAFQINGLTHYGWARLSVERGSRGPIVTLTGYAYETHPGWAIWSGVE